MTPRYNGTIIRAAGNILSGLLKRHSGELTDDDRAAVRWAVAIARETVAEVARTEPAPEREP